PDRLMGPMVSPFGIEYMWTYRTINVSSGASRIDAGEGETPIDFNSPIRPNQEARILTVEPIPAEGVFVTGRDPGEPGYAGFDNLLSNPARNSQYSTPALPLNSVAENQRRPGLNI